MRKSAFVKASYFATILTGNLAVEIEANPKAELVHGSLKGLNRPIACVLFGFIAPAVSLAGGPPTPVSFIAEGP